MNKVILIGRLVADPELRHTQSGTAVASYRLAVDRQPKKEGQPTADFLNCVAFGKGGEFASKYLHKGTRLAIEGRIQTRNYDDKEGKRVYVTEIMVDRHEFCESKGGSVAKDADVETEEPTSEDFAVISDDDDLPF